MVFSSGFPGQGLSLTEAVSPGSGGDLGWRCCATTDVLQHKVQMAPSTSLPGCLKAIWLGFWGSFLRSGRAPGAREGFKKVGGFAPHIFEGFPGPPGPARPQKRTQTHPARLPSSTHSFRRPKPLVRPWVEGLCHDGRLLLLVSSDNTSSPAESGPAQHL